MNIRAERPEDQTTIHALTAAAFAGVPYSDQTEPAIVDALRAAGALSLSLVAEEDGKLLGHIAFSPVSIDGQDHDWFGLGPVSVWPDNQRGGIGSALINEGLARLRANGAKGCVLLGDPAYYSRFGFVSSAALTYPGPPAEYFQHLSFEDPMPTGIVSYHDAFNQ
ncbi:MAG: N-acetyltransferase [Kordiimonadaceae bacterium]|nr:N-acetyltransferase [Kordiimonadaceae bacterium]MBO6567810.1 N-acetyltransferase [Kordiimonadaceae bacterium]MBO6962975.1 N-acetyltransferase [Kordiimonadaceae bacterium]